MIQRERATEEPTPREQDDARVRALLVQWWHDVAQAKSRNRIGTEGDDGPGHENLH